MKNCSSPLISCQSNLRSLELSKCGLLQSLWKHGQLRGSSPDCSQSEYPWKQNWCPNLAFLLVRCYQKASVKGIYDRFTAERLLCLTISLPGPPVPICSLSIVMYGSPYKLARCDAGFSAGLHSVMKEKYVMLSASEGMETWYAVSLQIALCTVTLYCTWAPTKKRNFMVWEHVSKMVHCASEAMMYG